MLRVEFLLVPQFLTGTLQTWEPKVRSDSLYNTIKHKNSPIFVNDSRLDIQGAKTFSITFSDEEAFDLKQSLYVNISGELSRDVSIVAQLSDSQSKLSPEGDSKELSSLDKVFMKIYGKKFELAMGDLDLQFTGTKYMDYTTKFEGITAIYKGNNQVQASYSAGSGKSTSLKLPILDGKQGPYYLKANDYQPGFIVVAGSEELFIDGTRLDRGVDYSIDYSEGSIMFKRLVSSSDNILVRYQYSDEYYAQSSYLNSSVYALSPNVKLSHHFIWQQDNASNPLLYEFSAADRDSLHSAGDSDAWGEGVMLVEHGDYKQVTSSSGVLYYEYAPNDSLAVYNIIFSYVGLGNGDYEEYSVGKYRYKGVSQGSWLPQKRLISPAKRGNLDLLVDFSYSKIKAGIEGVGTYKDKNSLSDLDDNDNLAGIAYAYIELPLYMATVKLDHEQSTANSFLFGKYTDPQGEYDFNALESADSLAQQETNLMLSLVNRKINSSVLVRYKNIYNLYAQKAVRLSSNTPSYGVFPALNFRSTLSKQDYHVLTDKSSIMQYHQGEASWAYRNLKLRFNALYNLLESSTFGTSYSRLSPTFSFGSASKSFSQLSFVSDETQVKGSLWQKTNESQTYVLKHLTNIANQRIDVEINHREIRQPQSANSPKSNYDLINIRSSNSMLKQAISLFSNYQLNQTEFYPKIRELQYIGNGLGLYDSTGVSIPSGDYDYVFITSSTGSLSSDINALFTLYLKPGYISTNKLLKRWQSDTTLNLNEQSSLRDDWKRYIFYPGTVYNESSTIYGKQNLQQNIWFDIVQNHITGNLQVSIDRSLDKRYQTTERSYSLGRAAQIDIKDYNAYKTRLQYNQEYSDDSRYQSRTESKSFSALVQRNLATLTNIQTEFVYSSENGSKQDGGEAYRLTSYKLSPSVKSAWMQKYRLSATVSVANNVLSGSNYFSFLPQKRAGWLTALTTSAIYRLNSFSSFSLDYRLTDYPQEKTRHELKLEFKAEL